MSENLDSVAGLPMVINWRLIGHVFCTWEIGMDAVEKILPTRLEPVDLRPGVGLLSIGCLRFAKGHFTADAPEFNEIVIVVHVQPDLSVAMPQPRFTFYAHSVVSDSVNFVDHEAREIFTPTEHVPSLQLDFSPDGLGVRAWDEDGPFLELRSTAPASAFTPALIWGQYYSQIGRLRHGIWNWQGTRFEHMQRGDPGKPMPHPYFRGLDVSKVSSCYRQMYAEPGRVHNERFYKVRLLD